MHARSACLVLLAAGLVFTLKAAPAASPKDAEGARINPILTQRGKVKRIPAVALSYDGQYMAWIVSQHGKTELELGNPSGKNVRTMAIPGDCGEAGIRWAPRWNELAILTRCKVDPSNTKPMHAAIWLLDVQANKPPRKVADLNGFATGMQWSIDAKRILFLYVPGATRLPEATASGNPRVGVTGETDVQVQRVASAPVAGGKPELLTPAQLYVHEFRVSPIGNRVAFAAAPPPGDDNWRTAKLYVQDATAGATPKMIVDPATASGSLHGLQIALPRWSPDTARILFLGGLMSDRGATGGDIYSVPASGGAPVNLTEGSKVTPSWYTFVTRRVLLVTQIVAGKVQVASYVLAGNTARQKQLFFTVPGVIGDGRAALAVSLTNHQWSRLRIAYTQSSFEHPPEIHAGVLGTQPPPAVTSINAGLKPGWGKARATAARTRSTNG